MNLYLICSIIVTVIIKRGEGASTPVIWTSSPYFVAGMIIDNLGRFSFTASMSGPITDHGTCTYASPLSGAPARMVVLGIVNWDYQLPNADIIFKAIVESLMSTGFGFSVTSNDGSYISSLVFSYLTADPTFIPSFSLTYFNPVNYLIIADSRIYGPIHPRISCQFYPIHRGHLRPHS